MLAAIGVGSVQELFDRQIPEPVRMRGALQLPDGQPEQEVYEHLRALAARNTSAEDELSFLGAGMYDHYVPALIDMLTERSEFLTPYTPYQPEISQGGLQVMFEYQTAISELTALPVSNASVYEGPSAVAAAGYLAKLHNGAERFVVSAGMHPHAIETLRTHAHGYGMEVVEVPLRDGATDLEQWAEAIDADTSAAIFAQPNFYGAVEDASALSAAAKSGASGLNGAGGNGTGKSPVVIAQVDPITLGILAAPGECGVDVAVGEGQPSHQDHDRRPARLRFEGIEGVPANSVRGGREVAGLDCERQTLKLRHGHGAAPLGSFARGSSGGSFRRTCGVRPAWPPTRKASAPLSAHAIASLIAAGKGIDGEDATIAKQVSATLNAMLKPGAVVRTGENGEALWRRAVAHPG